MLSGELIGRGDGFRIYHAMAKDDGLAPLGWLFIESERHVPYVADLSEEEAASLGVLRTRLANALREELGAEHVLTFVLGLGIAHFHEHLVPRLRDTSAKIPWHASAEALPKGGQSEIANLAGRLRARLGISIP